MDAAGIGQRIHAVVGVKAFRDHRLAAVHAVHVDAHIILHALVHAAESEPGPGLVVHDSALDQGQLPADELIKGRILPLVGSHDGDADFRLEIDLVIEPDLIDGAAGDIGFVLLLLGDGEIQ